MRITKITFTPTLTRQSLQPEVGYHYTAADGKDGYLWSPDGEGCVWYDTLAEMEEQHGSGRVREVRLPHPDLF
jgi:hypothetical protein